MSDELMINRDGTLYLRAGFPFNYDTNEVSDLTGLS